jgi:PKD repeat protein
VPFDGSGSSSVCGFPTLRWDFSDGGVAFGAHPVHTFGGSGLYSGQVTATDATGLTSSTTFSVAITNQPPAVDAGPAAGAAWGIPVALNGSATDPGIDDQSTLTYRWDFGDGSPSATGGPRVRHAYSTPGVYTATLRACDRFVACATNTTSVTIRKRSVVASYLGEHTGTYNTVGALTASLTDEFGSPVQGRTVNFQTVNLIFDVVPAGSASTNTAGIASRAFTPLLDAGDYVVSAGFAGDSLYTAADSSAAYSEAVKATTVTYTGALTGGPNKFVTLSAVLKDATGLPLAGRTVTFKLGSQTVSAATNATGIVTYSLKLTQKNGKYPLTASYAPVGSDLYRYSGSSASVSFNLQAK